MLDKFVAPFYSKPKEVFMPVKERDVSQEVKDSVTDQTVTDTDSAYEEEVKQETTGKEVVSEPREKPEPEDQRERSRLGREVKGLKDTVASLKEDLGAVLSKLDRLGPKREVISQGEDSEEIPEFIQTREDFLKANRALRRIEQKEQKKYEDVYVHKIRSLGSQNPDVHKEIFDEMMANFNNVITGDPEYDADLNYTKAKAALLSKKIASAKPKPNVRGKETVPSTNLSVESREETRESSTPELDEFAEEFRKKTGMKDESIKAALAGETPVHLVGKR